MIALILITFLLGGLFTGLLSGLLGVGGGVIFVPLQILVFSLMGVPADLQIKLAIGSSLAAIFFTSLSATITHAIKGSVYWPVLRKMGVGICLGAIFGSIIATLAPGKLLEILFGVAIIGLGLYSFSLHAYHETIPEKLPNFFIINILGFFLACISGMLGIGGGTLAVPALVYLKIPFRKALGTANAISVIVSIFGVILFLMPNLEVVRVYKHSIGYVYLPSFIPLALGSIITAPIGVRLVYLISRKYLKRMFAVVIMIVGLVMIFR